MVIAAPMSLLEVHEQGKGEETPLVLVYCESSYSDIQLLRSLLCGGMCLSSSQKRAYHGGVTE